MTDARFPTPFEDGYQAGIRGDDPRTCPYDKMTYEWNEWQRAHRIGTSIVTANDYHDHHPLRRFDPGA
jgi:ribosome modulation factor